MKFVGQNQVTVGQKNKRFNNLLNVIKGAVYACLFSEPAELTFQIFVYSNPFWASIFKSVFQIITCLLTSSFGGFFLFEWQREKLCTKTKTDIPQKINSCNM